jgi:hypothetical protein
VRAVFDAETVIVYQLERRRHGLDQLPVERPYPLPVTVVERISASA